MKNTTKSNWTDEKFKKKMFVIQLNLLLSAELPRAGDAALLTRLLEFDSLLWLAPMYPPKGPREDRLMFSAAATDKPAGTRVCARLLPATDVVVWLNWSDNSKFWVWVLCVWANCLWSRVLLRKFDFKRLVKVLPDPKLPNEAATPLKLLKPFLEFPLTCWCGKWRDRVRIVGNFLQKSIFGK